MSISNQIVRQIFAADGVTTDFAIPFDYVKSEASQEVIVTLIDIATGDQIPQVEGALQDYILTPVYDPVVNPGGPVTVRFNTAPAATFRVMLARDLPLTQIVSYPLTGKFTPKMHERGLDRIVFMIQQIADSAARAFKLRPNDVAGFDPTIPPIPDSPAVLGIKDDMSGLTWITISDSMAGLPTGGLAGAALVKNSDDEFDARWDDMDFSGYSARFSTNINVQGLRNALAEIFLFSYLAPLVSLSSSGSGTVREKGTSVSSAALVANITKRTSNIAAVVFKKDGSTIHTVPSPNPAGGSESYTHSTPFTDTSVFTVEVTDAPGGGGGPSTVVGTVTYTFVYPYYVGAGASGLTGAQIALLTKLNIVSSATVVQTITATNGQYFYFAYPASYPALTSILDVNNFETIADWTASTKSITGADGSPQSYRCYEFKNAVVAGSYQFTFKR